MKYNGLDFSKMNVKATRDSLKTGGDVVYKDKYYNSNVKEYKTSTKTKRSSKVSSKVRNVLVLAMKCKSDYEEALGMLLSEGLGSVKESYWDMAKRVGSYGEDALKSWIAKSNPISYYKENYN